MPTYRVESKQGQVLEIEGNQPPTEKELNEIFSQYDSIKQQKQSKLKESPKTGLALQDRAFEFGIDPFLLFELLL